MSENNVECQEPERPRPGGVDPMLADQLCRLASEAVRMEDDRGRGLAECAERLIGDLVIAAIAVAVAAVPLFGLLAVTWQRVVLASCCAAVALCYLAALILAIVASDRWKYAALEPPMGLADALGGGLMSREEAARLLRESWGSYLANRVAYNKRTLSILSAAKVLMLVGTGIAAAAIAFFFVLVLVVLA